jgi:Tfp pilus assembly protein PilX
MKSKIKKFLAARYLFFSQEGFAALYIAIIVLIIMLGIALSLTFLVVNQQKILSNSLTSYKSFSVSEAGIEDALLRLKKGMTWSSPYNLTLGTSSSAVAISDIVGGTRIITSTGNVNNRIRKVQVVYQISTDNVSFFYGAQAGDGGVVMANNSKIHGNVFSNGDISGGKGYIDNNVIVSGHHKINIGGGNIGGNALVYDCAAGNITGNLTYVNSNSCTVDGVPPGTPPEQQTDEIISIPLPILPSQIDKWKVEAAAGGVITTNVTISGTQSLGAIQIGTSASPKNLTINGTLNITGTIYVTGNITFNGTTRLDSSYGSYSGVIFADGNIYVENGAIVNGSGQMGSYLMALSTNNSLDPANPAIDVRNNAGGSIFYATSGIIYLKNNMSAREITGYKIQIENKAEIWYESGLENANFSSGPGGSWEVASWKEIE